MRSNSDEVVAEGENGHEEDLETIERRALLSR